MKELRFTIAQINSTVSDLKGNASKISEYIRPPRDIRMI